MSRLLTALRRVVRDLNGSGHPWAMVGGLAVSARAEPRTTRDVDIAVAVQADSEAEALTTHLLGSNYAMVAAVEQVETGRLATVRLAPPGAGAQGAVVDLLFASCGIERQIVGRASALHILSRLSAPVARTGDLIAMKVLSRDDDTRPQDAVDLRALLQVADDEEVILARDAVSAIGKLGFDRGRDLEALLEDAILRWYPRG